MIKEEKSFVTNSPEETENIATDFAKSLSSGDFIAFFGGLGMGKTAFVRGLAKTLCPNAHVSSPTFALVNEYEGILPIFHFDMYRIHDDDDLYSTGFYDYSEKFGVIAAEWSENIVYALPENRWEIRFSAPSDKTREIKMRKFADDK